MKGKRDTTGAPRRRRVEIHAQRLITNPVGLCCKQALPILLHEGLQRREVCDNQVDADVELIAPEQQRVRQVPQGNLH